MHLTLKSCVRILKHLVYDLIVPHMDICTIPEAWTPPSESLKTWRPLQVQLMKLSMSNTSSTVGHQASEAKTEKGPLPALPHKKRQLLNGRKTTRKCRILIQEKPNRGNRCLLPNSYFPFFQVRKKALWELASLCVPMWSSNHREVSLIHNGQ